MTRSTTTLLALLALAGCAPQRPLAAGPTAESAADKRTIVRVEVTNTFNRSIDVFYSSEYLGTIAPHALESFTVPPTTEHVPLYARLAGQQFDQQFNITRSQMVRYVYDQVSKS